MTAILGMLNKHGVAVAADSAETVGNGKKIYNKANKVFQLSKYHPVGIALYNMANFNGLVPWDIIIKQYRLYLGKRHHNTLIEYVDDFNKYLISNDFFCSSSDRTDMLNRQVFAFFQEYVINNRLCHGGATIDWSRLESTIDDIIKDFEANDLVPSISSVSIDDFCKSISLCIRGIRKTLTDQHKQDLYEKLEDKIKKLLYVSFVRKENIHPYMGVAFFGYGEKEIYPSIIQLKIYGTIDKTLKWYEIENLQINNTQTAFICPMAQTDVMQTFMRGIDPYLLNAMVDITNDAMSNILSKIAAVVEKTDVKLAQKISTANLDFAMQTYANRINSIIINKYVNPLLYTTASLAKEDLGEVAENLIYLTSLKRKITSEQESVGGPVDVAVVSKGDGFIWLKRKCYFDPKLNTHFFATYYSQEMENLHKEQKED